MLNRLFVLIGVLVILAIGGAFLVPRLIQWGDYRPRLESMASHAFGTDVAIEGDIHLTLLPQPTLEFTKVRVGPAAAPVLTIESVSADFSLFDFLRDQYKVTRLALHKPVLALAIGADGTLASGVAIAETPGDSSVSIANAEVVDGTVTLADARAAATYTAAPINGTLRLDALRGPFAFAGKATSNGREYGVRVATGTLDDKGNTTLTLALRDGDAGFALDSKGDLSGGASPRYKGTVSFRLPPPRPAPGEAADAGRGDFVLEGKVDATADKVLLTEYTALPDENRSAMRLTGAAEIGLGKAPAFKAVVSGGVVALPPRDATKELTDPPYELVRLLGELPSVVVPPLPGQVGLDLSELNLRAVSLRDLRLDATTDGKTWQIKALNATLPGSTQLALSGTLSAVDGRPIFAGLIDMKSSRLDLLAQLWRKAGAGNPLFGVEGELKADLALAKDTLDIDSGTLSLNGLPQSFDVQIGFGAQRALKVSAHVTSIGDTESAALGALLPDVAGSGSFGATFPKGEVDLSASAATVFGLAGADLAAKANWEGGVVEFSELSAGDLGGAAFDAKLTAFGTLLKPELSGAANIKVSDGAPVVDALLGQLNTPPAVRDFLKRSLPATLKLQLDAPAGDGGQTMHVDGQLGTAATTLTAKLSAGVASALSAPLSASLDVTSESPRLMTQQLGLGDVALLDDRTPLHLAVTLDGTPANSYQAHVALTGGEDHLIFNGNVVPGDFTRITGDGTLDAALGDPTVLVGLLGGEGVHVPAVTGTAKLHFEGLEKLTLDDIAAQGVTGSLALSHAAGKPMVSGTLRLAALDPVQLWPALAGPAAMVGDGGVWPGGPIDVGAIARTSEGRVDVTVDTLSHADGISLSAAQFGLDWDAQSVHLRNFSGTIGGGTLSLDATLCCANTSTDKTLSGRLAVAGVDVDALLPAAVGAAIDGKLTAAGAFDATGDSLAAMAAAASGSGTYSVTDFAAAHFAQDVFGKATQITGVVDMAPEALTQTVSDALGAGPFSAPTLTGTFTIAGGVLRSPNLAIEGSVAKVFGGLTLSLKDLGIDGRYAMTAVGLDQATAFDPAVAEVAAVLGGTVPAPTASLDVSSLVDSMKIKANEAELAILEQRRAEAEARAKAEAEAKAKAEAEAKAKAEADAAAEAARLAAEKQAADEAAKQAAADAAAKKAAAEAAKKAASSSSAPIDLGL